MIQRRFSDVRVKDTEICPTLEQGSGSGGNNVPMILYVEEQEDENTDREKIF